MRIAILLLLLFIGLGLTAQQDSLLTSVLWEETSRGDHEGYVLRLEQYGPFEEDAGENFTRNSRYLMGQWTLDSTGTRLTMAVDYFLGQKLIHQRYRRGQDFYMEYIVITLTADVLELEDVETGKIRSFAARAIGDTPDAAERRAEMIELGNKKKKGGLKIPKGW